MTTIFLVINRKTFPTEMTSHRTRKTWVLYQDILTQFSGAMKSRHNILAFNVYLSRMQMYKGFKVAFLIMKSLIVTSSLHSSTQIFGYFTLHTCQIKRCFLFILHKMQDKKLQKRTRHNKVIKDKNKKQACEKHIPNNLMEQTPQIAAKSLQQTQNWKQKSKPFLIRPHHKFTIFRQIYRLNRDSLQSQEPVAYNNPQEINTQQQIKTTLIKTLILMLSNIFEPIQV